jgi:cephalosporin hydroxylase
MIQLPEDAIRIQEVIWQLKPDVIIETGVAHGGSLIFYANVLQAIGAGEVIGIDIDIRPHNRREIEEHPLSQRIHLIEGDSAAESTLKSVRELVGAKKVMVILDSDHSKRHVYKELEAYRDIVSSGSYIIVTDGVMIELSDVPNGNPAWDIDNPVKAVEEFLKSNTNFVLEEPRWLFNESTLNQAITYWPSAWLKRVS